MLFLCPDRECWVCSETLSDAQVLLLTVTLGSGAVPLWAGLYSRALHGNQRNPNKDSCQARQKSSQKSLTDVQEVQEAGPSTQEGEGHLKVPLFKTEEMLSLQCSLTD